MSSSLFIEILVFIGLALFGLELLRRLVRRFVPRAREVHFDIIYMALVLVGVYLYFPKAASEDALRRALEKTEQELITTKEELHTTQKESRETKELLDGTRHDLLYEKDQRNKLTAELLNTQQDLLDAQAQLVEVNRRESLRNWAMLLPDGDMAHDYMGRDRTPGGQRTKDFTKVFQPRKGGGFSFAGPQRCNTKSYLDDVRYLIRQYENSPYPRVALASCLKYLGDTNWKKEATQAKADLEFYMSIEPRVLLIDGFYGLLVRNILDEQVELEDTGFFIRSGNNSYRPRNLPP